MPDALVSIAQHYHSRTKYDPETLATQAQPLDYSRQPTPYKVYRVGADGKRTPAGFVVPDFVQEDELAQFLEDLFHESASPYNGDVHRIV